MSGRITRRTLFAAAAIGAVGLTGALALRRGGIAGRLLGASEQLTLRTQRILLRRRPLAREFSASEVSPVFPVNGTRQPAGKAYQALAASGFHNWRLQVDGLVKHPLALNLEQLALLESRTQTTMHCCDEGWSAIATWTGVPLSRLLALAEPLPRAAYAVFHCLDKKEENAQYYYESIDLFDAYHPQTILAYRMNGQPLPIRYGAPLRLRVETQIGYKNAKYIERIQLIDRLDSLGNGRGGWWEDFDNAVWYAGQ
jgi:DMSO/TMAO reductase YedYZ molybdopterin-dependent catalytic subunit